MTEQDQIKALAELDGYFHFSHDQRMFCIPGCDIRNQNNYKPLLPYLTSYDAIIPLIQKQPTPQLIEASAVMLFKVRCAFDLDPAQLCEALLRATGKWKD